MIVQPDFLDHWKTGLLIELLDDQCAPMYVLRLWAHCQNRKTHGFPRVNPAITKAICKAPHSAEFFENCMVEAGFIEIIDNEIVAHDWADVNASLITSWENGKKGGRPKKKPKENPRVTRAKPAGNPNETDKRREEKIREDKKTPKALIAYAQDLVFDDEERKALINDWLQYRIELKKPMKTERGLKAMVTEWSKYTNEQIKEIMDFSISKEYQGMIWDKLNAGNKTDATNTKHVSSEKNYSEGWE